MSHSHSCGDEHHDHDHDGPDRGDEYTLYTQIDTEALQCLNEANPGSIKKIFKPHDSRFDQTLYTESDADEQLIIHIPFVSSVKLKSIAILGFNDSSAPAKMKAFINREDVDFDSVESIHCTQEWDLVETVPRDQMPEYPTRMAKFSNVRNLTLYFPSNYGHDTSKIAYIGLKGEWMKLSKELVITNYELAANPADHKKNKADVTMNSII